MISGPIISERRAAAARANGAKSRGPVSAQGKANSSRNSFRHGLRSQTLFDDREPGTDSESNSESNNALTALLADFISEMRPQSEIERALVETMAISLWNRDRIRKLETTLFSREMIRAESLINPEDGDTPLAFAFRALTNRSCALELLNRFDSRFARRHHQAFNRLHELRDARRPEPVEKQLLTNEPGKSLKTHRTIPTPPESPISNSMHNENQLLTNEPNKSLKTRDRPWDPHRFTEPRVSTSGVL